MATIKDIAREARVSVSTVSRILNGKSTKNSALVARIQKVAERLHYQANTAAAGLRTRRTKLIGLVVPQVSDDFFAMVLSGIESVAEARGYNILICQSDESAEKELKLIKSLVSCNVEGFLISPSKETDTKTFLPYLKDQQKEVVLFDRINVGTEVPYVAIEDYQGTYQMAKHLIENGRTRFLYVGISPKLQNDNERLRGLNEYLKEQKMNLFDQVYQERISEIPALVKGNQIDAIVCATDIIAAKTMVELRNAGFNLPQDIAIAGYDNRQLCEFLSPTLSSVNHSTFELGQETAKLLLGLLEKEEIKYPVVLPVSIVIRESTSVKK